MFPLILMSHLPGFQAAVMLMNGYFTYAVRIQFHFLDNNVKHRSKKIAMIEEVYRYRSNLLFACVFSGNVTAFAYFIGSVTIKEAQCNLLE